MNEYNDYSAEIPQQSTQNDAGYYNVYPAVSVPQKPKKQKKGNKTFLSLLLALICGFLSGIAGSAFFSASDAKNADSTTLIESNRTPVVVNVDHQTKDTEMTAAEVYAANVNSTVGITTEITTTNFWGIKTKYPAAGSGFIISENGYVVTNYHVVENGSNIKVATYDGNSYDAVLVGYDEANDVAVLKINAKGLKPVVLGSSETLHVGDEVIAIGNPLGELTFSLTKGNVSALNREVTLSSNVTMDLIQTDAAINSGNSGGALFNMYGEVVGITNAKYSSNAMSNEASVDNIGFAIPMDSVKSVITNIIEKGYSPKTYIGVELSNAADAALVYSVEKGSPAEKAGLKVNDIITKVNGEKIASANDLTAIVKKLSVGDSLKLTVMRGGTETELTVVVGEQPKEETDENETQETEQNTVDPYDEFSDFFGFPFGGLENF